MPARDIARADDASAICVRNGVRSRASSTRPGCSERGAPGLIALVCHPPFLLAAPFEVGGSVVRHAALFDPARHVAKRNYR
jgi:hypothetical protein